MAQAQTAPFDLLQGYLEELSDKELRMFKYKLIHLGHEKYQPIPKGQVEKLDRSDIADKMISVYGEADALNVMFEILKRMNLNNLVQKLNKDLQKCNKAGCELGDTPEQPQPPVVPNQAAVAFVDKHRPAIIQGVSLIDPILDDLHGHIGGEKYSNIRSADTSQKKMRRLYDVLNTDRLKELFYDALKKNESYLVVELHGL